MVTDLSEYQMVEKESWLVTNKKWFRTQETEMKWYFAGIKAIEMVGKLMGLKILCKLWENAGMWIKGFTVLCQVEGKVHPNVNNLLYSYRVHGLSFFSWDIYISWHVCP